MSDRSKMEPAPEFSADKPAQLEIEANCEGCDSSLELGFRV